MALGFLQGWFAMGGSGWFRVSLGLVWGWLREAMRRKYIDHTYTIRGSKSLMGIRGHITCLDSYEPIEPSEVSASCVWQVRM